jgi:hypothetical protein
LKGSDGKAFGLPDWDGWLFAFSVSGVVFLLKYAFNLLI